MERIRLAQISDLHLGRSFSSITDASAQGKLRQTLRDSFSDALRIISSRGVDFLLICGDVFDRSEPLLSEASFFAAEIMHFLERNPEADVIVIPGGHDHLGPSSPYNTNPIRKLVELDRFYLFNSPEPSVYSLDRKGIRIAFHARSHTRRTSGVSPLSGLQPDPEAEFNIAMAHGGIADLLESMSGAESTRDPVKREEIELFDYVAMGDWHGYLTYPDSSNPRACYSGSLEPTEFEEKPRQRGILFVEIEKANDTKVKVELENISKIRHRKLTIHSLTEIEKLIQDYANNQLILFLEIEDETLRNSVEDRLARAENIIYFQIESSAEYPLPDLNSLPATDLRLTIAEVAEAEIEDAALREEVLKTIFAGLEGYDV